MVNPLQTDIPNEAFGKHPKFPFQERLKFISLPWVTELSDLTTHNQTTNGLKCSASDNQ